MDLALRRIAVLTDSLMLISSSFTSCDVDSVFVLSASTELMHGSHVSSRKIRNGS